MKTLVHESADDDVLDGRELDLIEGDEADLLDELGGLPEPVVHEDARRGETMLEQHDTTGDGLLAMRRTDRTKVRYGDRELPYRTRIWDANGVESLVFTADLRHYLAKRDPQTGKRIFFAKPPRQPDAPLAQCEVCKRYLATEDEVDAHMKNYHRRRWDAKQRQMGVNAQAQQVATLEKMIEAQATMIQRLLGPAASALGGSEPAPEPALDSAEVAEVAEAGAAGPKRSKRA